jgi:hypothetical protein
VRKRFPEESAQIRVRVADLQRRDGNPGIEDMLRGLGLSTTSTDTDSPREPESPSAAEGTSTDTSNSNDGYKTIDVRVEWSRTYLYITSHRDDILIPRNIYRHWP